MTEAMWVAVIGFCGAIAASLVTALISAHTATHRSGSGQSARDVAIDAAVTKGHIDAPEDRTTKQKFKFRTSTGKLIARVILSIISFVVVLSVGESFDPDIDSVIGYSLIGLSGLFTLIAVVTVFRLIYRLFWVVFIA